MAINCFSPEHRWTLIAVMAPALLAFNVVAAEAATARQKRIAQVRNVNAQPAANPKPMLAALAPARAPTAPVISEARPVTPLVAVVSLSAQSVTVYSGTDVIAKSPISSGMDGYRTPTGVFSIIQKNRYHESNIYDGAPMPFMQRLTWSGIAMHAGRIPGYRASHGCIRLPDGFAQQLFGMSKMSMRVIVTPETAPPHVIQHAGLPTPTMTRYTMTASTQPRLAPGVALAAIGSAAGSGATDAIVDRWLNPMQAGDVEKWRANVAAATAAQMARQALDVAAAIATNADAARRERVEAEQALPTYRALLEQAERMLKSAVTDEDRVQAEASVEAALEAVADAAKDFDAARLSEAQVLEESFVVARRARESEDAAERADAAARAASRGTEPVTVFVSRRENKVLVRQGFMTILEGDVRIRDSERPLGTHVFTAGLPSDDHAALRWTSVSIADGGVASMSAAEALSRVTLDPQIVPEISKRLWTGATLIISDQGVSNETGKGTDFVVLTK